MNNKIKTMEVVEIISNYINKDNNVVEVEFRIIGDNEDMVRTDTIEFEFLNDFGYGVNFMSTDILMTLMRIGNWDLVMKKVKMISLSMTMNLCHF